MPPLFAEVTFARRVYFFFLLSILSDVNDIQMFIVMLDVFNIWMYIMTPLQFIIKESMMYILLTIMSTKNIKRLRFVSFRCYSFFYLSHPPLPLFCVGAKMIVLRLLSL